MKRFLISAAVLSLIAAAAVLVLSVSMCQTPDPGPDPSTTVTPIPPKVPVPEPSASAKPDVLVFVQTADSATVKSAEEGRFLLTMSGVSGSVKSRDGGMALTVKTYLKTTFKDAGSARATLEYDESRSGPTKVTLFAPKHDPETKTMSYEVDAGGEQILSKITGVVLRVKPL